LETTSKRKSAKAALFGTTVGLVVVAAIAGVKALQFATLAEAFANPVIPAERVNAFAVQPEQWESRLSSVGSVVAVQGTDVSAEAEGVVRAIEFTAGGVVHAGAVLLRLDDEIEQSRLRAAEAAATLARVSFERAERLIGRNAISQADLEAAEATRKQADAEVDNVRALIAKKVVRAPFTGRLGIRRVSVGDFLAKGSPVVSLQSLDPVYVEFSLPQQRLGDVREALEVTVTADSYVGREFSGRITAVESRVDAETRNFRVQATLANADGSLRPGMFVAVDVTLDDAEPVLVIPVTAVASASHGDSVFVIEPVADATGTANLVVRQQPVKLGLRRGDFVTVEDGALAGEQVVATGVFKLRGGMPVIIDNTLAPEFSLAPAPDNS
jgi:membrane fusion protein (multidrug efflux system)